MQNFHILKFLKYILEETVSKESSHDTALLRPLNLFLHPGVRTLLGTNLLGVN